MKKLTRYNKLLTPMCKYYASEMCLRVANDSVAVLGGSGFMKDYPVERNLRDAWAFTWTAPVRSRSGGKAIRVTARICGNCFHGNHWP